MPKTAFVFAGGGSFGAVQVGMLHALVEHGVKADFVVGSSVGAINGAYFAGDPTMSGVTQLEKLWLSIRRRDIFRVDLRTAASFLWRRDFLMSSAGLRRPPPLPAAGGSKTAGACRGDQFALRGSRYPLTGVGC